MRKDKKKRLEAKGWKIGNAQDFLDLSEEGSAYIELKIRLAEGLRQRRRVKGLSQVDLAARLEFRSTRLSLSATPPAFHRFFEDRSPLRQRGIIELAIIDRRVSGLHALRNCGT